MSIIPLTSHGQGYTGKTNTDTDRQDIVDEAITLFRANILFKNFTIKGNCDRLLIYLTLFITQCLSLLTVRTNKSEGLKKLINNAVGNIILPGEPRFPLNQMFLGPKQEYERENLRQYLLQLRQETVKRLVQKIYGNEEYPSKWWLLFSKRKFMGKTLQ